MAKKKLTAKEKREQRALSNKQKGRNFNSNAATSDESLTTATTVESKDVAEKKTVKKSYAKANGLKSILITGDKVCMTSFGRGNKAVLEKEVVSNVIRDINTDPQFDAKYLANSSVAQIDRRGANIAKPGLVETNVSVRNDLIGAKSLLEKRYFGVETNDSNIHIQLIYNILDIEKMLAIYVDNIIYTIGNITRKHGDEYEDLIGTLGDKSYLKIKEDIKKYPLFLNIYNDERLQFLGKVFYETSYDTKAKKEKATIRPEEDVYYILCLLGGLRQFVKHGEAKGKARTWLYSLDDSRVLNQEERRVLDIFYDARIKELNKNFIKTSSNDLTILINALKIQSISEKKQLINGYYKHVVCKDGRNVGFSVKKLREYIVAKGFAHLKDKEYNGVRSKMYKLFDYAIYNYYTCEIGAKDANRFVDTLRSSINDFESENAYIKESSNLYDKLKDTFISIINQLGTGSNVKSIKKDSDLVDLSIDDVCISSVNTSYFSKLLYLLTLFIDGKEINDLLSSLINKFENIASFVDILYKTDQLTFKKAASNEYDYTFFEKSQTIADELRVVKSIARMEVPLPSAKPFMYVEALKVLGLDEDVATDKTERFTNKEGQFFNSEKKIRNFIANNVIESSRFQYLIRYANVEDAKAFSRSRAIVSFVLRKLPDEQINRYYESCAFAIKYDSVSKRREELTNIITSFDTAMINVDNLTNAEDKQRIVACIGLYLTVIYLVVKNLVNVNSRYTIALHSLERDTALFNRNISIFSAVKNFDKTADVKNPFYMTDLYIDKQEKYLDERVKTVHKVKGDRVYGKRANRHGLECIKRSRYLINDELAYYHIFRLYRNAIAHLSAVSNAYKFVDEIFADAKITSYYSLFHYFMQRYLKEHEEYSNADFNIVCSNISDCMDSVVKYHGFNKDLVWALNAPFAYNPPRYKSLSMENLFYKDTKAVLE